MVLSPNKKVNLGKISGGIVYFVDGGSRTGFILGEINPSDRGDSSERSKFPFFLDKIIIIY